MTLVGSYGSSIYWHETAPHDPRPSLAGPLEVDVAIVGGGYTGLWTAYHLQDSDEQPSIAVLEGEEIGFGASGRNGGFAMTLLDMSLAHLHRNHGTERAAAAHRAVAASVEEIGEAVARHGIDCEWVHGGLMVVATNRPQLDRVEADLAAAEAMGLEGFTRLDAQAAQAEVHSPAYVGGLLEEHCAVLHPAKLARGLARVVEERGARVYEGTPMTTIDPQPDAVLVHTPGGVVRAQQVVLATCAWAAGLPWFRRKITPLYTYISLTEPLTDAQWDAVGWERRQGIEDKRNFVHYYRRTDDGRILWGGSDGVIYPGGAIRPYHDRSRIVLRRMTETFRRTFPQLRGVRFTHHWGGPVGITASFLPIFGTLPDDPRVHYGLAYNGHGVAPTHTGGKVLRDKVLGRDSEYTGLCFVDGREAAFPPEPLRWVGAELTRRSLLRQDGQFDRGEGSGEMDPLLLRVVNKLG
jgi:glycine/D-amino acid oxidase-like deaminating enzyme